MSSWGSCSLCSVKLGLTDVSILSDLIVHSGKKLYWFVWTITKVHRQTDQRQRSLLKPGESRCLMTDVKHLTSLQWNHKTHIWHTQFIENKNIVNTVDKYSNLIIIIIVCLNLLNTPYSVRQIKFSSFYTEWFTAVPGTSPLLHAPLLTDAHKMSYHHIIARWESLFHF